MPSLSKAAPGELVDAGAADRGDLATTVAVEGRDAVVAAGVEDRDRAPGQWRPRGVAGERDLLVGGDHAVRGEVGGAAVEVEGDELLAGAERPQSVVGRPSGSSRATAKS